MDRMGVKRDRFGDATTRLAELYRTAARQSPVAAEGRRSMAYTIITLRGALKEMGVASATKPWIWQANDKAVNPKLQQQFPYGRAKADYSETADKADKNNINKILNDLTEYCWIAYPKSFERSGPHLIGRTDDLWVPEDPKTSRHHGQEYANALGWTCQREHPVARQVGSGRQRLLGPRRRSSSRRFRS